MKKMKVIIHINSLDKWAHGLGNARNLIADIGDTEYDIILIANGEAIHYYRKDFADTNVEKITGLSNKGVQFKACNNSLKGNNLVQDDLHSFIEVVPAGITELVTRQQDGYAYVKA